MAYLLFLLTNAALFARPAELLPALGNLQVYLPLIASATLCNLQGLGIQVRTRTLIQQPVNLCVLGLMAAVPLSHLIGTVNFGAAARGGAQMAKFAVFYFLLVSVINTPVRLRRLLLVTVSCATVVIAVSIVDFHAFCARWSNPDEVLEQLEKDAAAGYEARVLFHAVETHGYNDVGDITLRYRMRGLGIFSDPNDVALLICISAVIACYFLTDRSLGEIRLVWLIPLLILGYGYILTQSRGGLLAFAGAGMVWLAVRYGGKVAMTLGVMGLLAAPVVLGRAGDIDVSSGSGQERIQLWSEGLMAIRGGRFLFGIGEGQMVELAGLVAHNSYIHAFVELGFFGGTLYLGSFLFSALGLYRVRRNLDSLADPELRRMLPYVSAIMAAWCVGMLSLSLCYSPATYMIVGLGAAYVNLAGYYRARPRPIVQIDYLMAQRLGMCSFGVLLAAFAAVKVFARFGG